MPGSARGFDSFVFRSTSTMSGDDWLEFTMHTRSAVKIWGTWTAVVISTLVGMETYALKTRRIPPATTFLKLCCGVEPVKPWRHLGVTVFAGFFGWLVLHVCFDLGPHLKERGGTP